MTRNPTALLVDDALWYKDAVIYQLHVKSFCDSDNDGVGDFPGLISKLDYIAELGVDVIWLLPFYPSPRRDDGYDIAEYRGVHPDYGSMADVRRFIAEAHEIDRQLLLRTGSPEVCKRGWIAFAAHDRHREIAQVLRREGAY